MAGDSLERTADGGNTAAFVDADGNPTEDPGKAVRGEIVDYDASAKPKRRTWLRVEEVEVSWLPISESAFLLWVLVLLALAWLAVAFALGLF